MTTRTSQKKGFAPQATPEAEVLILGSKPGETSLKLEQYYAHPRNLFWQILDAASHKENHNYQQRLSAMKSFRVALWDVLQNYELVGSTDSESATVSEVANDIPAFLEQHPNIRKICFNGERAWASFHEHILSKQPEMEEKYEFIILPSTSSANAETPAPQRYQRWVTEVWNPAKVSSTLH